MTLAAGGIVVEPGISGAGYVDHRGIASAIRHSHQQPAVRMDARPTTRSVTCAPGLVVIVRSVFWMNVKIAGRPQNPKRDVVQGVVRRRRQDYETLPAGRIILQIIAHLNILELGIRRVGNSKARSDTWKFGGFSFAV